MSGAPIIKGTIQFPNPPINAGITMKKIITKACPVTNTLYNWWLPDKIWFPGCDNSKRINTDIVVPITPENAPKSRYNVPMSLWLVENSQREIQL